MALRDLTASSVLKALEEFDRIGRDAFLDKFGFGKAHDYFLVKDGVSYDSKAIAGAAHGYLPGFSALAANDFSGGEATVKKTLENLGFKIRDPVRNDLPSPGSVLTNEEIGRLFAVGNMGGMRRSTRRNLLVLISDPYKGLYQDRWEGEVLHYTGMGPEGDQDINYSQNRTLTQSPDTGISVHLLEALDPQKYTYGGEVGLAGDPYQEEQLDQAGQPRKVWMFPLRLNHDGKVPVLTETQARTIEELQAKIARGLSTEELRARAKNAKKLPSVRAAQTSVFVRDAAVAEYARRLANGKCDLCGGPAPFFNKQREAYLECHHVIWLSRGGEDTIDNTVALCPNCHRKVHVVDAKKDMENLKKRATDRATPR